MLWMNHIDKKGKGMINGYQFLTLIAMLAGGFACMFTWLRSIDDRLNGLEKGVIAIETILAMMGAPIKGIAKKERSDP